MKKVIHAAFICLNILSASSLMAAECFQVSSGKGWQTLEILKPIKRISGITGGWSVDDKRYHRVGPEGHFGDSAVSLTPYSGRKYDKKYAFGALLIEIYSYDYINVVGPLEFQEPVINIRARINDRDDSLGDNGGSLELCLE